MSDLIEEFVITNLIIIVLIGGMLVLANFIGNYNCNYYSEMSGRNVKYSFLNGCYVQKGMEWVPQNQIREFND